MADHYEIHPFCKLIPEMTPEEYADFRDDIKAHGLNKPIMIWQNHWIVDGRHRDRACTETGVTKRYVAFQGKTENDVLDFVISENVKRRHLTPSQRALIAADLATMRQGARTDLFSQPSANLQKVGPTEKSQEESARKMNVSTRSVADAAKVTTQGAPELVEAVRSGKVAVSTAATLAAEPVQIQQEIVARGEKEIVAKAKEIKETKRAERKEKRINELSVQAANFELEPVTDEDIKIICADSRDLLDYAEPGSVDLVVTSPPYNVAMKYDGYTDNLTQNEYRDLLGSVFSRCEVALKEGGRTAVVVPLGVDRNPYKPFAPFIHDILLECGISSLGWIVWDKNNVGNRTSWGSHRSFTAPALRDRVEIILVGQKGDGPLAAPDGTLLEDASGKYSPFLRDPNYFAALTQNVWQVQPETRFSDAHPAPFPMLLAQRLIHLYAFPGALICDPLMGTGTTLVAAKKNGCRAIGIDQSKLYCALARERLVKEG